MTVWESPGCSSRTSAGKGLHPDEVTIAEILKAKGYATACVGKWHLGDEPEFLPTQQGFDSYFGIPYSNDMRIERDGKRGPPLMRGTKIIEHPADQSTLTRRYTEAAVRFIAQNQRRPFFLYLPHTMPHTPLFASEAFRGKSKRGLYGDVVEEIDWSVGQILAALKTHHVDEHTLVVFTSDNGPWLARGKDGGSAGKLRDGKFTAFEGGMRVPCLMRWPGKVPAAAVCRELCATIDLLPTFAALSGAALPTRRLDGASIVPLITGAPGAKTPHREYFYNLDTVRAGRWKLMLKGRSTLKTRPAGPFPGLYDLMDDLSETTNVAAEHAGVVARLTQRLEEHRKEIRRNRRPVGQALPPAVGPRILILGDSISIGYTEPLRQILWGVAQVFRPMQTNRRNGRRGPENCAGTDKGIEHIDRWLAADGGRWDLIHFNFGLHDLKHVHPKTGKNSNDPDHPRQTPVEEYERQLLEIVIKLQKTDAKLIFATTTPFPAGTRPLRDPGDVDRYNAAARRVMAARGIAVNDLHAFASPRLARIQQPKNVHFTKQGSRALARQVARNLRRATGRLGEKK